MYISVFAHQRPHHKVGICLYFPGLTGYHGNLSIYFKVRLTQL